MSGENRDDATPAFVATLPTKAALLTTSGAVLLGLVALYVDTYNMAPPTMPGYPGDAFFPRVILVFSAFWAVIVLIRGLFFPQWAASRYEELPYFSVHWLEFASVIVLVLLYALLVEPVGFEITTVTLMMVLLAPRLLATPRTTLPKALLKAIALSLAAMFILYLGLGAALKIGLPLIFLPVHF